MAGMTTRELLEKLYNQDYEKLKGKKLRMTRVRVPGKEVCLAHVINPSQSCIYQNLGSLQRIIDPYGRSDGSSDCSGRSGEIF